MKGFYRAMMLLLVFCLCGAVIVGCGGDGTTETTGEETTAAGTEDGSDVTTAPGTETERNTEGKTTTDTEEVTTGLSDAEIKKQKMDAIRANTTTAILPIGGWSTPASALRDHNTTAGNYAKQFQKLADAGIGFMITLEEWSSPTWSLESLKAAKAAGMKLYYNAAGQELEYTKEKLEKILTSEDADAFAGVYVMDEPNKDQLDGLATLTQGIRDFLKEKGREDIPVFSNLLPTYAGTAATGDYLTYIRDYAQKTKPSYLLFDYYPYGKGGENLNGMMGDLATFRKVANETGIPMFPYVQSSGSNTMAEPTENQLLANAHINLAFGSKGILYFLLCEHYEGWEYTNILKADGKTTRQYTRVQSVNKKLQGMQGVFLSYENQGMMVFGNDKAKANITKYGDELVLESYAGLKDAAVSKGNGVLIGCFRNQDGQEALYVVNCDTKRNTSVTLTFDHAVEAALWGYEGLEDLLEGETLTLPLDRGQGVFLVLQKDAEN